MARAKVVITQSWAVILAAAGYITVEKTGAGVLLLNNSAADETALAIKRDDGARQQVQQKLAGNTYGRATGDGWEVITDTDGIIILPKGGK